MQLRLAVLDQAGQDSLQVFVLKGQDVALHSLWKKIGIRMAKVIKNIFCKKVSKSFNYVYYLDILLGESTHFALTKQIAVSFLTIGGVFLFVFVYVFACFIFE